jgi:hypothetical protein
MPLYNFGIDAPIITFISSEVTFARAKEVANFLMENGSADPEAFVTTVSIFESIIFYLTEQTLD